MKYNGSFRVVGKTPFWGSDIDGMPIEVGLFTDGFHCGYFANGEWVSLGRVVLKRAYVPGMTNDLQMEWGPEELIEG